MRRDADRRAHGGCLSLIRFKIRAAETGLPHGGARWPSRTLRGTEVGLTMSKNSDECLIRNRAASENP